MGGTLGRVLFLAIQQMLGDNIQVLANRCELSFEVLAVYIRRLQFVDALMGDVNAFEKALEYPYTNRN